LRFDLPIVEKDTSPEMNSSSPFGSAAAATFYLKRSLQLFG
jgi:hypothetical protein